MTRPRAQQINDLQTRFFRAQIPSDVGPVWDVGSSDFTDIVNASVTGGVVGGADEDTSAYLVGTVIQEPYIGISVGNQFTVTIPGVNSGNPVTVTFQAGDFVTLNSVSVLTASFVAARINATLAGFGVSAPVASGANGFLQLRSANGASFTTGDSASVTVSDVTPGVVQKLGFGVVSSATANGISGPRRGFVTESADGRGGTVYGRGFPSESLLVTKPFRMLSLGNGVFVPDFDPGHSVYARMKYLPALPGLRFSFFAQGPTRPRVVTSLSKFTTLGAGDTLRIVLNGTVGSSVYTSTVDVAFSVAPVTVQDVVNKINQAWHTATDGGGLGAGKAVVIGSIPEPYQLRGTAAIPNSNLVLNNNTPITISFVNGETTAEQVVARINALISGAGQAAQGSAVAIVGADGLKRVAIQSSSIDGTVSSVILSSVGPGKTGVLERLGMAAGEYHGSVLATVSGGAEIEISSPIRRTVLSQFSTMTLSNFSGTPLTKMGLSAGSVQSASGEEPVSPNLGVPDAGLDLVIPEVLEFGEVPAGIDDVGEGFSNNRPEFGAVLDEGVQNVGKFPGLDAQGRLPASVAQQINDFISAVSIQLGSDASSSAAALAARILTPHSVAFGQYTLLWESVAVPAPASATDAAYRFYAANDGRFIFTVNAKWGGTTWSKDVVALAATKMSVAPGNEVNTQFSFLVYTRGRLAGGTWNESQWSQPLIQSGVTDGTDTLWNVTLGAATALRGAASLLLQDANTVVPNQLTSGSDGANLLRVLSAADPDATPTLFKRINARWTVTVGDGTTSFGDFNGVNAIQQAIAFWNGSTSYSQVRIQVKNGTYNVNAGVGAIVVPDGKGAVIEGVHKDGVIINVTDSIAPAFQFGTGVSGATVFLKNLTISHSGPPFARVDLNKGGTLVAEDCTFSGSVLQVADGSTYNLVRCFFSNLSASADKPCITMLMGDGSLHGPFKAFDCTFNVGQHNPALLIKASGPAVALTTIGVVEFTRCFFNLSSTTNTGGNLTGNCGVVDCDPNGSNAIGLTGVAVSKLTYAECNVIANVVGGAVSILMHLQPQANGLNAGTGYLAVHRLEIRGGRWWANAIGTTFNPFTISDVGGADIFQPGVFGPGVAGAFISDVMMGFDRSAGSGFSMGTMTADSKLWWLGAVGDTITTSRWAAFAFSAFHLEMSNVQFSGMSQLGGCGDLIFRWNELSIKDVTVKDYMLDGASGTPGARVRFRPRMFGGNPTVRYADVDGLKLVGATASSGDWATAAIVSVEPWTGSSTPPDDQTVLIRNSTVEEFLQSGGVQTAAFGITVPNFAAGALYTSSPTHSAGFTVKDCSVSNVQVGIGFTSVVAGQSFSRFRFLGNRVVKTKSYGILANTQGTAFWNDLMINENYVSLCGVSTIVPGIYVSCVDALNHAVQINDNFTPDNNDRTGVSAFNYVQIRFEILAGGVANDQPTGIIMGNSCGPSATPGYIRVNRLNGASAVTDLTSPADTDDTPIRGLETGYDPPSGRLFSQNSGCLHNVAFLLTQ